MWETSITPTEFFLQSEPIVGKCGARPTKAKSYRGAKQGKTLFTSML